MKKNIPAFTMIEVAVVVAILGIVAVVATSPILNYYRTTIIDTEVRTIVSDLQKARQRSIGNDTGSDYSVKFLSGSYVLYPGSTYGAGNPDNEEHLMDTNVLLNTTFVSDNIVFSSFTGRTGASGSITLQAFGVNKSIVVNELGIVEDIT